MNSSEEQPDQLAGGGKRKEQTRFDSLEQKTTPNRRLAQDLRDEQHRNEEAAPQDGPFNNSSKISVTNTSSTLLGCRLRSLLCYLLFRALR